jgi:hypothetical protein
MADVRLDRMTGEEYAAYHRNAVPAHAEAHVSAKN